jgi:hypothetical protein
VVRDGLDYGLNVRWCEGEPLDAMEPAFGVVTDYARQPGKLLVHGDHGICRAPQVAVAATVARGVEPIESVRRVYAILWNDYEERHTPDLHFINLHEMFCRLGHCGGRL